MTRRKARLTSGGGPYEIRITRTDMNRAVLQDPNRCVIARAIKRSYPEAGYIRVGHDTIRFSWLDESGVRQRLEARTSIRAMEAQQRFDSGQPVAPEDFGTIRFYMDEVRVKPSQFTEETRVQQNAYRAEVRAGVREPVKMSETEKAKRRLGRRHA